MIVLEYKAMYNIWVKVLSDFFTDKESLGDSIFNFNKCRNTWMMAILVRAVVQNDFHSVSYIWDLCTRHKTVHDIAQHQQLGLAQVYSL